MKKHWHIAWGMVGCLPDYNSVIYEDEVDAREVMNDILNMFDSECEEPVSLKDGYVLFYDSDGACYAKKIGDLNGFPDWIEVYPCEENCKPTEDDWDF